jgi:tetratricopeptide (TPR) repeat protein
MHPLLNFRTVLSSTLLGVASMAPAYFDPDLRPETILAKLGIAAAAGALGYLGNRRAAQDDQALASKPATVADVRPNHHLARLAGDTLDTLLQDAESALIPVGLPRGEAILRAAALDHLQSVARDRWLSFLEDPESKLHRSFREGKLADAIADHVAVPEHARVLSQEVWTGFARAVFTEEDGVTCPAGFAEAVGEFLYENFAREFYEHAKQAAGRQPVTYAAMQLHLLGGLRHQSQQQQTMLAEMQQDLAELRTALQKRVRAVAVEFDDDQSATLSEYLTGLGTDFEEIRDELRRLPQSVSAAVTKALGPQLQAIEGHTVEIKADVAALLGQNELLIRLLQTTHGITDEAVASLGSSIRNSDQRGRIPAPTDALHAMLQKLAAEFPEENLTLDDLGALARASLLQRQQSRAADRTTSEDLLDDAFEWFAVASGPTEAADLARALDCCDRLLTRLAAAAPQRDLERDAHLLRADTLARLIRWDEAIAAARAACALVDKSDAESWLNAQWKLGDLLYAAGHYPEAVPMFTELAAMVERWDGRETLLMSSILSTLGNTQRRAGHLADAEKVLNGVLQMDLRAAEVNELTIATDCNNLGILYHELGRDADAEQLHRRALAIHEEALRPDHPSIAGSCDSLGQVLNNLGQLADAERFHRRALTIREKALGPDHPDVASSCNNLGVLLNRSGEQTEVELLYRRALAINEKALGPDHPTTATNCNNLGVLLNNTGRLAEAELLHRRALAIREKTLGPDHPDLAGSCYNLGLVLNEIGFLAEAELLYRRTLAIREKTLGPDHPTTATSCNNLAVLLGNTGRLAEAELLHRRALAIREKALGPDHPDVADSCYNLGSVLSEIGRMAEAELLHRRALAIREKTLGPDHPNVASSCSNLGTVLCDLDRPVEGEVFFRRNLQICEHTLAPDHLQVAFACTGLSRALRDLGRPAEAEPLYRRALAIEEHAKGPDHPDIAITYYQFGHILTLLGRLAEAETFLRRAIPLLEAAPQPDRTSLAYAHFRLAQWHEASGHRAEALAMGTQALEFCQQALPAGHPYIRRIADWLATLR